jgi:ribonuclease HII
MLAGVDEAGKGAVLGPLVVAAVGWEDGDPVAAVPVRDSKVLSPQAREHLSEQITAGASIRVLVIEAHEIDAGRQSMTMNLLLARAHARVIAGLRPTTAYVDACDVNAARYGRTVAACLDFPCRVVAEHHADATRPVVSAASIVAKVTRDRLGRALAPGYGEVGSGYPSDPVTIAFLSRYIADHGTPPGCARSSWETTRQILCRAEQADLSRFLGR